MSSDVFWKSPPWRHLNAVRMMFIQISTIILTTNGANIEATVPKCETIEFIPRLTLSSCRVKAPAVRASTVDHHGDVVLPPATTLRRDAAPARWLDDTALWNTRHSYTAHFAPPRCCPSWVTLSIRHNRLDRPTICKNYVIHITGSTHIKSQSRTSRPYVSGILYAATWWAILTCAQKLTYVSLIYRTEPTTENGKRKELKSKNG